MQCTVKEIDENGTVYANDLNYGQMSWFMVDGRMCCSSDLGKSRYYPSPMAVGDTFYGAAIILQHKPGEPTVHAKEQKDVLAIAQDLSLLGGETIVLISARIMARFKDGELVQGLNTLDKYYVDLTDEELAETDLSMGLVDLKQS